MADAMFRRSHDTPREIQTQYKLEKRIGKGSYGVVFEAMDNATKDKVAIKCIEGVFNTVVDAKRTLREITILRQCNHINIVGCRTVLRPPTAALGNFANLWVVLDVCKWDLGKVMRLAKSFKGWSEQHVKFILYQTLCGMNYLHGANIVHRDLKPSNLLVTEKCEIRICDFGLSREIRAKKGPGRTRSTTAGGGAAPMGGGFPSVLTKHVVTRWYRAPELILLASEYSGAIDVWSVGCIFAELMQTLEPISDDAIPPARTLFPGDSCYPLSNTSDEADVDITTFDEELSSEGHQLNAIFDMLGTPSPEDLAEVQSPVLRRCLTNWVSKHPKAPKSLKSRYRSAPDEALALLSGMLQFNPRKRSSLGDAMKSPYLKDSHQGASGAKRDSKNDLAEHGCDLEFDFERIENIKSPQLRKLLIEEADKYAAGIRGPPRESGTEAA